MKLKTLLLLIVLYPFIGLAQNSGAFVTNFKFDNNAEKWCWAIAQDQQGQMIFGVSKGIIVFDGISQVFIKIPFTPTKIVAGKNENEFWVAGYQQVGLLVRNEDLSYSFTNKFNFANTQVTFIEQMNDKVYFISDTKIYTVAAENEKLDSVVNDKGYVEQVFLFNNELYFIIDYFLYNIENNKLKEVKSYELPVDDYSFCVADNNKVILGTVGNTVYTVNKKNIQTYEVSANNFFENNLILEGQKYDESTVILSSLAGGVALLDLNKMTIINQINYFNGLPDDEIRALFVDKDKGIWVSHEFGVSRIDLTLGIENYNFYPGLKGNPVAVTYLNNKLYVATNDGLFTLDRIKNYNVSEFNVDVPVEVQVTRQVRELSEPEANNSDEDKKHWWERKNKKEESQVQEPVEQYSTKTFTTHRLKQQTITKRSLKSISYYYTLVKGMNGKYRQLTKFHDCLLAAGNSGLYAVRNGVSEQIIKNAYINEISLSVDKKTAMIATANGIYQLKCESSGITKTHFYQLTNQNVQSVILEKENICVFASDNRVIRAKINDNELEIIHNCQLPEEPGQIFFVKNIGGIPQIFTDQFRYEFTQNGELKMMQEFTQGTQIINTQPNFSWLINNGNVELLASDKDFKSTSAINMLNLNKRIRYIDVNEDGSLWVINENNQILRFSGQADKLPNPMALTIRSANLNGAMLENNNKYKFTSGNNLFKLELSLPFYITQNGVEYSYLMSGLDKDWSTWSAANTIEIKYIPPGKYKLKVKARNTFGQEIMGPEVEITKPKPFTQTVVFYLLSIALIIALAFVYSKYRMKKLEKAKEVLEQKVKERTHTIELQKDKIEKQHDEITQSIKYAQRIQKAMLPLSEIMDAMLPNHFVLFMPRDIVSGDFYFFKPLGKYIVFVAADCTGHGVPGGFMSMLGISYLSEITSQLSPSTTAAEIINHLREKIKITLGQTSMESTQKDGMDLAICLIDTDNKTIQFAGAFNPLYVLRNGQLDVVKADRQPVSVYFKEEDFTNNVIQVQKGDKFYMCSDGFQDQIGGPNNRKFMSKNFKTLLLEIQNEPMNVQKEILQKTILDWRGSQMQVDDILVVGFEL